MSKLREILNKAKGFIPGAKPKPEPPEPKRRDAIKSDSWDQKFYDSLKVDAPMLQDLVTELDNVIGASDDLVRDTVMQLWKDEPKLRDRSEMEESHHLHHTVADGLSQSPAIEQARSHAVHNRYGAAMAAVSVADEVQRTVEQHKQKLEEAEEAKREAEQAVAGGELSLEDLVGNLPGHLQSDFVGPLSDEQQAEADQAAQQIEQAIATLEQQKQLAEKAKQQQAQAEQKAAKAAANAAAKGVDLAAKNLGEEDELLRAFGVDAGNLERLSFEDRRKLADRLKSSRLAEFAKLLGRFKMMAAAQQSKKVEHGRDEVVGTMLTSDFRDLVSSEYEYLALMSDDDKDLAETIEYDFLRRMTESMLLARKFEGIERVGKGPVVVCWDESGSMQGLPEAWSKALTLAMADQAKRQGRDFHGIAFASHHQLQEYHFTGGKAGIEDVVTMTEHFFNGGTDFESPLKAAIDAIRNAFHGQSKDKADVIFITDGVSYLDDTFLEWFHDEKLKMGFRTFGVLVTEANGMMSHGGAEVLVQFCDDVRTIDELTNPSLVADLFQMV